MYAVIRGTNMQRVRLDNANMAGCRFFNTDLTDAIIFKRTSHSYSLLNQRLNMLTLQDAPFTVSQYGTCTWKAHSSLICSSHHRSTRPFGSTTSKSPSSSTCS